jgi:DNA-binding SARP family transcriptional activator
MDSNGVELLAGHRKELALLAYLVRRNGQSTSRAELADLLWGDREAAKARHSLRQALASLRTILNSSLEAGPDAVRLLPGSIETDIDELTAQLAAGRCDEASADWRAPFLADAEDLGSESYRDWLEAEREGLRRHIALSFERLHAEARRAERWQDAAVWAERWAELRPHDERAQVAFVDALQDSGRAAEALEHYRAITVQLRELAGAEPSASFLARAEQLERSARTVWSQSTSPGSAALFTPDLVGRDAVLAELMASWQSVRSGHSAVVVVEGEAGLGKTRVCTEFLRRVEREQRGLFALQARGSGVMRRNSRSHASCSLICAPRQGSMTRRTVTWRNSRVSRRTCAIVSASSRAAGAKQHATGRTRACTRRRIRRSADRRLRR